MMPTTASALVELLESYDVQCVFGIPGVHTLELYRSLPSSTIQHITPRHEQGAGFMADGYARVSNKPGVCFIISGPGMTNIITAMAQAWSESIPMLVISSVNAHGRMNSGDGWLHELSNQQALINGVCAFSHTLHNPAELEQVMARAFAVFDSERPRPVHIEIPINILTAPHTVNKQRTSVNRVREFGTQLPVAAPALITRAAHLLSVASSPLILAGGGAQHSAQVLSSLAEQLDAPVVMTVNARGVLASTHPLAVPASASLPSVRALIEQADVVLGVGTELGPTDYDFFEDGNFEIPGAFIRIDIDAQQIQRSYQPSLGLVGDARLTCIELMSALSSIQSPDEQSTSSPALASARSGEQQARFAFTQTVESLSLRERSYLQTLTCIRDTFDEAIIVGDSTQLIYAGNSAFGMNTPSSWFNSAMGFGTLGYALPAAIGAAQAAKESQTVVAISGDGGLQFCLAELASAVDANLSIILIVHENGGYAEIDNYMQAESMSPVGVKLMAPDFAAIATAFQWQVQRLEFLSVLSTAMKEAHECNSPVMILISDSLFDH